MKPVPFYLKVSGKNGAIPILTDQNIKAMIPGNYTCPARLMSVLCLALILQVCSPALPTAQKEPQLSVTYLVAPLIRGLAANKVVQLRIYVHEGQTVNYSGIRLLLDAEAVEALDRVDVYTAGVNDRNSHRGSRLIGTAQNVQEKLDISIDLKLEQGLHYIWLSPVLKDDADPDLQPFVRAEGILSAGGRYHPISVSGSNPAERSNFKRRIGIALRKAGDAGVHTYRIPGMTSTDKGTLISVYDVRYEHSGDLPANIDVGMSRSTDGGKTWEPMKIIMDMGRPEENSGVGDPSILFDPLTKKIWVAALWSKGNRSIAGSEPGLSPEVTGQFVLVSSDDDGATWSKPYSITEQVKKPKWHLYFNGPGNGIAMENGTLVFPSQYWDESKKPGIPHASIIYSEDHGNSWKSGTGARSNTTESQVVETSPGTLMLNMRDNRGKFRSVATSKDMGRTWLEHPSSYQALIDPVCMASLIKARVRVKGKMQDVLLFSNVASQNSRVNMTIKASLDLGETWLPAHELLLDERMSYGYSSLTMIDGNTVGILYEGERDLYFMRIKLSELGL